MGGGGEGPSYQEKGFPGTSGGLSATTSSVQLLKTSSECLMLEPWAATHSTSCPEATSSSAGWKLISRTCTTSLLLPPAPPDPAAAATGGAISLLPVPAASAAAACVSSACAAICLVSVSRAASLVRSFTCSRSEDDSDGQSCTATAPKRFRGWVHDDNSALRCGSMCVGSLEGRRREDEGGEGTRKGAREPSSPGRKDARTPRRCCLLCLHRLRATVGFQADVLWVCRPPYCAARSLRQHRHSRAACA